MCKFFTMTMLIASVFSVNNGYSVNSSTPWVVGDENAAATDENNEETQPWVIESGNTSAGANNEETQPWVINNTETADTAERHPFEADQEIYDKLEREKEAEINKKIDELLDRFGEEKIEKISAEIDKRCRESNVSDEKSLKMVAEKMEEDFCDTPFREETSDSIPGVQERCIHHHCCNSDSAAIALIVELAIVIAVEIGKGIWKAIKWIGRKIKERIEINKARKASRNMPEPANWPSEPVISVQAVE